MQRRRGVSPIVAELLLIAVTVAIGSSVFFVASSSVGGYTSGFSLLFGQSANQAKEIYILEYAQFGPGTPSTSTVTLTIRNVGYIETLLADVSFFNRTDTTGATSGSFPASVNCGPGKLCVIGGTCTFTNNVISIPVGNFCTVQVKLGWGTGTSYNVVMSTSRGNSVVVQEIA